MGLVLKVCRYTVAKAQQYKFVSYSKLLAHVFSRVHIAKPGAGSSKVMLIKHDSYLSVYHRTPVDEPCLMQRAILQTMILI